MRDAGKVSGDAGERCQDAGERCQGPFLRNRQLCFANLDLDH
jgi:hypothetical protein